MPAKNAASYIVECLESILSQSYNHWELIVINDHSTDHTKLILQEYALEDSRISVFENNGTGIVSALQLAFAESTGQFITRMDADDKMAPNKIQLLLNALLEKGQGHVATGYVKYFSETQLKEGYQKYETWLNKLTSVENNYDDIYKECVIPSPCWMTFRQDFKKVGAFDGPYPEDYDLCFRFRLHQLKVIGIKKIIHYWRDYENRTSRTDDNYADNSFLDIKVFHFLKQDHIRNQQLILWGAGRKGKKIASKLIEHHIEFNWACDNPNKIGHNIYDKILLDANNIRFDIPCQIIVAVAQKGEQEKIRNIVKDSKCQTFFFC